MNHRGTWLAATGFALLTSHCGTTTDDGSIFNGSPTDATVTADSGTIPGTNTGSSSGNDGLDFTRDGGTNNTSDGYVPPLSCKPRTCEDIATQLGIACNDAQKTSGCLCGPQGDGCGGTLYCGSCTPPETCGGGGVASKCGGQGKCVAKTCQDLGAECGLQGDGCGGVLDCNDPANPCKDGKTCGGGGVPSKCGGTAGCIPKTCTDLGVQCGKAGDGCGGIIECGVTVNGVPNQCANGAPCGSGGPSKCATNAVPTDAGGAPNCTKKTCAQLNATCGEQGDGCGGVLNCGTCTAPETCGGGGVPSRCGGTSGCVKTTCSTAGKNCGPIGDGCGGTLDCGTCSSPQICGGNGPGICGGVVVPCVPKTCTALNANCGPVGDGCGGTIDCGTCTGGNICGGGGVASQCGGGNPTPPCTGLCQDQAACTGTTKTTFTGTVYAPNGAEPLYNAIVYVPTEANANLSPFTQGVTCDQCATTISPAPLVKTTTDVYGRFTLTNVPAGKPFPVVIQLGRWRRKFTIPAVTACQTKSDTQLGQVLRMPKNQSEGDIPKTALVTGAVDTLECVLRNMGLDDSEFTGSNQTGRIHIYRGTNYGSQSPAKAAVGTTLEQSSLWTNPNLLKSYDLVFLSCEGSELDKSPWQDALLDYVNSGGRAYGTHFNYTWFWDKAPFSSTAQWNAWGETAGNVLANVDVSFQKGKDFAAWLSNVGALANNSLTAPQISLNVSRHNVDAPVGASTQQWVTVNPYPNTRKSTSLTAVQHLSFNTPLNKPADQQCGRVLFSDFHVRNANVNGASFPSECGARGPLTAQEKVLEFFFFDLAQCIEPPPAPPPPSCTPKTCAQLNATCGVQANGCGGTIDCGTCIAPATCGGGGVANQCGGTACTPINCQSQGIECGPAGDGCGKQIDCGSCPPPQTCGGSGQRGKCGGPSCLGKTCSQLGLNCGPAGDGCGNLIFCGECTKPGDSCGGGGSPGVCGQGTCKPKTCTELNANCGYVADGCGGVVNCGVCQNPGDVCGGAAGGQSNKCAPGSCTAKTCAQLNANCGLVGDGCGGQLNCGVCPLGQTCGGAGTPNQCGAPCTPKTCAQQNIECGPAGDGCGGVLNCGTCVEPDQCGGGGTPFKCGRPVVK